MFYFVLYVFSSFLCEFGIRCKQHFFKVLCCVVAVLVPAFFAGMRDYSIGVDRSVYGDSLFLDVAKSQDLFHLETRWENWIEKGYIYFNFVVSQISKSVEFFYFCLAAIICSLVLIALIYSGYRKYVGIGYAAFLFLFFQPSFNMMRQSLAAAIVLVAISFLFKEKIFFFFLTCLLAYSMHHSAIIAVFFFILYYLMKKESNPKMLFIYSLAIFVCMCGANVLIDSFFPFFNMDASRYTVYFEPSQTSMRSFNISGFCLALLIALVAFNNWKGVFYQYEQKKSLMVLALAGVLFSQIGFFGGEYVSRIVVYFNWSLVLLVPALVSVSKRKIIIISLLFVYFVSFWFYYFIVKGFNQTYPYTSQILGIL